MDPNLFDQIKSFIVHEIDSSMKSIINEKNKNKLVHNHPPLRFKVDDCEYCKKFGNIFCSEL